MDDPAKNLAAEASEVNLQNAASGSEELRKRRSTRIVQAVPLVVTGVDALGRPFTERTSTLIINCHGCRYQSKHYVLKNMWVTLDVPSAEADKPHRVVRGRVAWIQRPRTVRQLFQVALELETPGNAWGIAFPPEDWFACEEQPQPAPESSVADGSPAAGGMPPEDALATNAGAAPALPPAIGTDNLRVFPSPVSGTDASLQLARHVARLVADAKQQIQAEVREAAGNAVSAQHLSASKQWEQKFTAAREDVLNEAAHAVERIREESERRSKAAAEALKTELPLWLAPQLETLAQELAQRLSRESEAQRSAHAEQSASLGESLRSSMADARQAAEALRRQTEEAAQRAREIAEASAGRAGDLDERAGQVLAARLSAFETASQDALCKSRNELLAAVDAARERIAAELNAMEERLRQAAASEATAAAERTAALAASQAGEAHRLAGEKFAQDAAAHVSALQQAAARASAEAEARFTGLQEVQQQELARLTAGLDAARDTSDRMEGLSSRLEAAGSRSLADFQTQLDELATLRRNELQRQGEALAGEWAERMRGTQDESHRDAVRSFEEQVQAIMQPHLSRADEAIHRLAGGRSLLDASLTLQQERIRNAADESFAESLARFRETLGGTEQLLQDAARNVHEQALAELQEKAAEMKRRAAEEIAKSAEWYEKKAQTQIQGMTDRAVEHAGSTLREQAGEVSSLFAGELDRSSRNFVGHTQTQMEEAVREGFDRARALFAEAADTTSAAFTDEIQRHAREELAGFTEEVQRTGAEMRSGLDTAQAQVALRLTAEQEEFLRGFREKMQDAFETGIEDARRRVQTGFAPLLQSWEAAKSEKESELRGIAAHVGSQAAEEYRGRLENISNSWMVATVATLDHQSRTALAEIGAAAEKHLQEACARVFAGMGERLREQLEKIAGGMRQEPRP